MINWSFQIEATTGVHPPKIKILTSDVNKELTFQDGDQLVSFESKDRGLLSIDFFNKTESDTVIDSDSNIVKDSMFRIKKIWCDDIVLEPWFLNDAVYQPRYFAGFLAHNPDAPTEIRCPYQFNFPGTVSWSWSGGFWDWYFTEKNNREIIHHLEHDPDRVWKFRGSLDPCEDLVVDIKNLLDL